MRSMWNIFRLGLSVLILGLPIQGNAQPKKPASALDTPEGHYEQGMRKLESDDLQGAQEEFQQVLKLNANYMGGYVGLAYLYAKKKDSDAVNRYLKIARGKDKKSAEPYIAEARIIMQEAGKNWLKEVQKTLKDAQKRAEKDDRIPFYEGEALRQSGLFQEAENAFSRAMDLKGPMEAQAARALKQIQLIRRAAPGTEVGMRIAQIDPVTRADMAALLIDEMKLEELVEKRTSKTYDTAFRSPDEVAATEANKLPEDLAKHWAKAWVERTLPLKVPALGLYPDGTFRPNDAVTRKDLAMMLQGLLVLITGDPSLTTAYLGSESTFKDVRGDVFYFNAVSLSVSRGLMEVDKLEGTFRPDAPVSGAEALMALKDLKLALMTR